MVACVDDDMGYLEPEMGNSLPASNFDGLEGPSFGLSGSCSIAYCFQLAWL